MEDVGWDPLEETQRLYNDVGSLMGAPLNPYAQVRLGLLRGGAFCDRIQPSARAVVKRLKERATAHGCDELVELLEAFFNDAVRNAFFHSDYILHDDEFRSREASFVVGNVRTSSLKLDMILDLINRGAAFFHDFMQTYGAHRHSYKEPKVVRGRIGAGGAYGDVTLLVHPTGGVYGFRSGSDGT